MFNAFIYLFTLKDSILYELKLLTQYAYQAYLYSKEFTTNMLKIA